MGGNRDFRDLKIAAVLITPGGLLRSPDSLALYLKRIFYYSLAVYIEIGFRGQQSHASVLTVSSLQIANPGHNEHRANQLSTFGLVTDKFHRRGCFNLPRCQFRDQWSGWPV